MPAPRALADARALPGSHAGSGPGAVAVGLARRIRKGTRPIAGVCRRRRDRRHDLRAGARAPGRAEARRARDGVRTHRRRNFLRLGVRRTRRDRDAAAEPDCAGCCGLSSAPWVEAQADGDPPPPPPPPGPRRRQKYQPLAGVSSAVPPGRRHAHGRQEDQASQDRRVQRSRGRKGTPGRASPGRRRPEQLPGLIRRGRAPQNPHGPHRLARCDETSVNGPNRAGGDERHGLARRAPPRARSRAR